MMIFTVVRDPPGPGLHHMTGVLVQNTELETCYQPRSPPSTASSTDSTVPSPVWPHQSQGDKWFLRRPDSNRCFEIRHHQGPKQQGTQHQQTNQQPAITTTTTASQQEPCCQIEDLDSDNDDGLDYVLEGDSETSDETPDEVDHKSKEEMDKVIAELTSAIVKSKAVSAMAKADQGGKQVAAAAKKDDRPDYSSRKVRTLKNLKHPQTGRKTHRSFHNKAYLHDERIKTARGGANLEQLNPAFIAGSDGRRRETNVQSGYYPGDPGVWQLTRKQRQAGLCGELDYKNYNYNYGLFLHDELQRQNYLSQEWWNSYGDQAARRRKKQKLCRQICKSFCVVILLISFVVVVICVSVFIIKDKYKP